MDNACKVNGYKALFEYNFTYECLHMEMMHISCHFQIQFLLLSNIGGSGAILMFSLVTMIWIFKHLHKTEMSFVADQKRCIISLFLINPITPQ